MALPVIPQLVQGWTVQNGTEQATVGSVGAGSTLGAVSSVNGAQGAVTFTLSSVPSPGTNVAMASHKLTGLAAGTTAGDSVRYEQLPGVATHQAAVTPATDGTAVGTAFNALLTALSTAGLMA